MTDLPHPASAHLYRTALWGAGLAAMTVGIMLVAYGVFYAGVALDWPRIQTELIEGFGIGDLTEHLGHQQRWVLGGLWMVPDFLGLAMMAVATRLFWGIRTEGVFTETSTRRIRTIGWLIFAIAPGRILATSLGAAYAAATAEPASGRIHLSLEDLDLYAVIIGLLFVAIGHIMRQAVDISNENKSFV